MQPLSQKGVFCCQNGRKETFGNNFALQETAINRKLSMSKKGTHTEEDVKQNEEQAVQDEQTQNTAESAENATPENEEEQSIEEQQEDEITLLKKQLQEANDKYLRLYSDFENFRRRNSKEKLDLMQNAGSELVKELLPVVDDFERANASNLEAKEIDAIKEGFELIYNKLSNTLKNKGLKPMATEAGDDFDTDKHEAITNIPAPKPELKGKVVDIIEKGYLFNDKVLRYAKVVVGQ